ncbi:MAG: hypothetical protein HQK51_04120 [Oligoflexia bacterium]|nr:hypothetical protein [Oligoflexia bacterium]
MKDYKYTLTNDTSDFRNKLLNKNLSEFQILFKDLFCISVVEEILDKLNYKYRKRIYDPFLTLWIYITEVLSEDKTLRSSVINFINFLYETSNKTCSSCTGGYSQARERLPLNLFSTLAKDIGDKLHKKTDEKWKWFGRNVKIADGSTIIIEDTDENRKVFPIHPSQQSGVGYPIARLEGIASLGSGSILNIALAPYEGKQI